MIKFKGIGLEFDTLTDKISMVVVVSVHNLLQDVVIKTELDEKYKQQLKATYLCQTKNQNLQGNICE
jgi:hypothetical protein